MQLPLVDDRSPRKEETPVIISGKPVQMVYPLKMHGEKNPLPVGTCIEAMRGHGRCHTTRNFEPYSAYNFKEGDIALAYSGNQQVAFRVGRQYRITSDMISDPNYQKAWASKEKHSYKELLNFKRKPNVWGLEMEPLGDYIEGKIVPFPTVRERSYAKEPRLSQTTTTAPSNEIISTVSTNQLLHQDILKVERGVIVHQVNCQKVMGKGLAKDIRDKWPEVYDNYQKKQWKLGDVQLVQVSDAPLYVANVAGQDKYGTQRHYTDFDAIATGLKRVNAWATQQNLPVYIPFGLGSGLAGGRTQAERDETWRRVREIIKAECPTAVVCSKESTRVDEKVVTIVFTGNREQKFRTQAQQEKAKQVLAQMIDRAADRAVELGYSKICYISGTAPGVDTWAADICLQQSQSRQDIQVELVAAAPTKTFPDVWPADHKSDYQRLLSQATRVHYVSDRPYSSPSQLHKRNEWMCDQLTGPDDLVLAVHNGSSGGTQKCIDYAVRQGKAVVVYNSQTEKFISLGNWSVEPTRATRSPKQLSHKSLDYER